MIDRKPLKRGANDGRRPEKPVRRLEGGGAPEIEEGEVELVLVGAGGRHDDLDPADAQADQDAASAFRTITSLIADRRIST